MLGRFNFAAASTSRSNRSHGPRAHSSLRRAAPDGHEAFHAATPTPSERPPSPPAPTCPAPCTRGRLGPRFFLGRHTGPGKLPGEDELAAQGLGVSQPFLPGGNASRNADSSSDDIRPLRVRLTPCPRVVTAMEQLPQEKGGVESQSLPRGPGSTTARRAVPGGIR